MRDYYKVLQNAKTISKINLLEFFKTFGEYLQKATKMIKGNAQNGK